MKAKGRRVGGRVGFFDRIKREQCRGKKEKVMGGVCKVKKDGSDFKQRKTDHCVWNLH